MRRDELQTLVRPLLQTLGLELVECQVSGGRRVQNFRLTIDRDEDAPTHAEGPSDVPARGVDLDACARVSRQIARLLDADPVLQNAYSLEVSTPGMNRPIWTRRHFERFIGERAQVELAQVDAGPRTLIGRIGPWDGEGVWIDLEPTGRRHVRHLDILEAHLRIDPWEKVRAARGSKARPEREKRLTT